MSGQLAKLEAAGLIARARATDRRRIGLTVSPAGDRVLRSVRQKRTAWLTKRLDTLTDAERDAIEQALEPLQKLLAEGR